MTLLHQIVAGIPAPGDSPVVLFDFDEWFGLAPGTDFSPPPVRVSSTWTQLNDGEEWGASTLGDRTISLNLTAFRGNAEDHAEVLQTLAQLLNDHRGQWFLWQDEGTVNERYFRTKRASLSIEDLLLLEDPQRVVTIKIPAEPTAYGPAITGTATIANNPTAATNPMTYVFPDIKGDVRTPLWLQWEYVTDVGNSLVRAAIATSAGDVTPDDPTYLILNDELADTQAGWATADQLDADFINGTRRRLTKTSGTSLTTVATSVTLPTVPGDYRVLARMVAPPGATLVLSSAGDTDVLTYKVPAASAGDLTWYDMGVARLPLSQPSLDPARGLVPVLPAPFSFKVGLSTATGVIDADTLLFIPVGLDEAVDTTYTGAAPGFASSGFVYDAILDGVNELAYAKVYFGAGDTNGGLIALDGDFAAVTPGVKNVLHLVPYMFAGSLTGQPDDKGVTTDIEYLYYPRYLYIRSATG